MGRITPTKRLEYDDLNNEGVIMLLEVVLSEIKNEGDALIKSVRLKGTNNDNKQRIRIHRNLLKSDYYNKISMGHGEESRIEFDKDLVDAIQHYMKRKRRK